MEEQPMNIGKRLKALRAARNLSQLDIEKRTGLMRSYVSRVENGFTTPSLKTFQRWAKALEVEVYQLFFEGDGRPEPGPTGAMEVLDKRERQLLVLFRQADEADRQLMLHVARKVAKKEA
jgi:transcriptional regulator with XRE-family HTH domain